MAEASSAEEKPDPRPLGPGARLFAGALGGLLAMTSKFLGQDATNVVKAVKAHDYFELYDYGITYCLFTPILMFIGACVAWAMDDERSRLKLLAIGVAAPALITTWSGAGLSDIDRTVALASPGILRAEGPALPPTLVQHREQAWPEVRRETWYVRAFKRFFNIYEVRYWVIVASLNSREQAVRFADSIRGHPPTRQTYVGLISVGSGYWPVFAAPGETLPAARRRLEAVRRIPQISRNDPFIFAY